MNSTDKAIPTPGNYRVKGVEIFPTYTVKLKGSDVECVINQSDFDPEKHVRLDGKIERVQFEEKEAPPHPSEFGTQGREELSQLSMEELKKLPEGRYLEHHGRLQGVTNKLELLDEIFDVRQ